MLLDSEVARSLDMAGRWFLNRRGRDTRSGHVVVSKGMPVVATVALFFSLDEGTHPLPRWWSAEGSSSSSVDVAQLELGFVVPIGSSRSDAQISLRKSSTSQRK